MSIYIGLGTNLGNREENLSIALEEIKKFSQITQKSSIYETEPVGNINQGNFLNMVIEISTTLSALELIFKLQEIEHTMGRQRIKKNEPRIIDLDIILYDNQIINQPNLKIPHPRLHQRNFVLKPLSEIAGNHKHPKFEKTIKILLKELINPEKISIWT